MTILPANSANATARFYPAISPASRIDKRNSAEIEFYALLETLVNLNRPHDKQWNDKLKQWDEVRANLNTIKVQHYLATVDLEKKGIEEVLQILDPSQPLSEQKSSYFIWKSTGNRLSAQDMNDPDVKNYLRVMSALREANDNRDVLKDYFKKPYIKVFQNLNHGEKAEVDNIVLSGTKIAKALQVPAQYREALAVLGKQTLDKYIADFRAAGDSFTFFPRDFFKYFWKDYWS